MKKEMRENRKALYNSAPILLSIGVLFWPKAPMGTRDWIKIARPRWLLDSVGSAVEEGVWVFGIPFAFFTPLKI
jgi:hypothetical protein